MIRCIITAILLFAASAIDIKKREIPNAVSAAIALTALIGFDPVRLWGLAAALFFFLTAVISGGIGGGDIKLFAALSVVCGLWESISILIISHISFLIFFAAKTVLKKGKNIEKGLPFAPFLTVGFLCTILIF